jgi:hypothetical protein
VPQTVIRPAGRRRPAVLPAIPRFAFVTPPKRIKPAIVVRLPVAPVAVPRPIVTRIPPPQVPVKPVPFVATVARYFPGPPTPRPIVGRIPPPAVVPATPPLLPRPVVVRLRLAPYWWPKPLTPWRGNALPIVVISLDGPTFTLADPGTTAAGAGDTGLTFTLADPGSTAALPLQ